MSDGAYIIRPTACPYCGYVMQLCTPGIGGDAPPQAGNVSICIECGELSEFTANKHGVVDAMAKLSEADYAAVITAHPQVARVCKEIKNGRFSRKS